MKLRHLPFVLALALLAVPGSAQGEGHKKSPPVPVKGTAQAASAGARAQERLELTLHVTGLSAENAESVHTRLTALTRSLYTCEACHVHQAQAGKCPHCASELKSTRKPEFTNVRPTAADGTLQLGLPAAVPTRLSEIERALKDVALTLDAAQMPIPGPAQLVLAGGKAGDVATIDKLLQEARLYASVHAAWDAAGSEIHVQVAPGSMVPTRGKIDGALAGASVHVRDVVWGLAPKT